MGASLVHEHMFMNPMQRPTVATVAPKCHKQLPQNAPPLQPGLQNRSHGVAAISRGVGAAVYFFILG